jgi:chromosome segregation ATPase
MAIDWGRLLTILTGFAGLAGTVYAIIKAIRTAPSDILSADAGAAKSYAEAAKLSAEHATSITQQNNALMEALRRTSEQIDIQGRSIKTLQEKQNANIKRINDLENENRRLHNELVSLKAENEELRKTLAIVQEENRLLKARYDSQTGGNT